MSPSTPAGEPDVIDVTAVPEPEPTATVGSDDASYGHPAGSAAPPKAAPPLGIAALEPYADRPEVLAGGAFAAGLLSALILKRLGR